MRKVREVRAVYNVKREKPLSKAQFRRLNCCRSFVDPKYFPPTASEIQMLFDIAEWSQNEAADILGVSGGLKGSTSIRRWKADPDSSSFRAIPYATWRLALFEAGIVQLESY